MPRDNFPSHFSRLTSAVFQRQKNRFRVGQQLIYLKVLNRSFTITSLYLKPSDV